MTFSAAKEFKTNNRRFMVDAPVSEADVTGYVLTWELLKEKGFVVEVTESVVEPEYVVETESAPEKFNSF